MWVLHYVVVIQVAVGLLGLLVIEPEGTSESVSTGDTTTTTVAAPTSTAPGTPKTTTTIAGAKETTTTSTTAAPTRTTTRTTAATGPSTTTTTRPASQGLTPAKAGSYDYRTTYTDAEDSETTTGNFSLGTAKEQDGEVRQVELDDDGETTTTTSYAWRADGLWIRTITSDGSTCNFEPDLLLVPSPPTVGRSWRIDTSCTEDGETISLTGTSRTARNDRIAVAGRQVDVVVIETTVNTDEGDITGRLFFSVAHGLVVRDETTYDDGSSEVRELLNVDPK